MMLNKEHSRLNLVREVCLLFLIEACVYTLAPVFPFTEVIMAQSSIVGGYLAVKTVSNVNQAKYERRNIIGD